MKLIFLFFSLLNCNSPSKKGTAPSIYNFEEPQYDLVHIQATSDTLHFLLDKNTYNRIKSFNTFIQNGIEFISFYDERSQSVNIYNLSSHLLAKRKLLKEYFKKNHFYKTSVYTKNIDSILVNNGTKLYLLNGIRSIKKSISFLQNPPFAWAIFENARPPVFKGNVLFVGVRPYADEASIKSLRRWKVLYEFDLANDKAVLHYNLPKLYQENFYGRRLVDYSYCYNQNKNFVFSFSADSTIYETNLSDYHVAYYGKSHKHNGPIKPVSKKSLLNDEGYENYLTRDSYGPIYFDPFTKRYLRVMRCKISQTDYQVSNRQKKQGLIIFNEDFKIIGESVIDVGVSVNSIFFTSDGKIYARVKTNDEYALHFVRLIYKDKASGGAI